MIPLPNTIKQNKIDDNHSIFEIEPFYPGYGITIGNAFRRVLLSSLEGAAVSKIKIKNVAHEFEAIPGVEEDVLRILLNIKQLRFKIHSDEPQVAIIKASGEKEVTGKDVELPSTLELANKDLHIANLTDKKAEIEIEVTIEKGFGYETLALSKEKQPAGVMVLDKIFTPIVKVRYEVENVRVGDKTNFEKLIMEIETDGTIKPKDALVQSVKIITDHFNFFNEELGEVTKKTTKKTTKKKISLKIEDLDISEKIMNSLTGNEIKKVADLENVTEEALLAIKGIGKKGLKEIKKALKDLGTSIKE